MDAQIVYCVLFYIESKRIVDSIAHCHNTTSTNIIETQFGSGFNMTDHKAKLRLKLRLSLFKFNGIVLPLKSCAGIVLTVKSCALYYIKCCGTLLYYADKKSNLQYDHTAVCSV